MTDQHEFYASNAYWDQLASAFDDEPDHGLRDPLVRAGWKDLLNSQLPSASAKALDVGCGTGSLSVLLAELGHLVTGVDVSPEMITFAQEKTSQQQLKVNFHVMDAARLDLPEKGYDIVLCRHLLWVFSDPTAVLQRWGAHLRSGGRLICIEGYWDTGGGIHPNDIVQLLPPIFREHSLYNLSQNPTLWGKEVNDERYMLVTSKI